MTRRIRPLDLTLSITTLRRPRELDETLTLVGQIPNIQVILNGADTKDYAQVIRKYQDRVRFIANPTNIGIAATFNQGIVTADTRYVVLSGDDLRYTEGWLESLLDVLGRDKAPMQVSLSEPVVFSSFCIDKALIPLQGWFDHNFTRIYYEDEDWRLRSLERLGIGGDPVSAENFILRLGVVLRQQHETAPWNSIPNRLHFWRKWQRLDEFVEGALYLRHDLIVGRKLEEPEWPYLSSVLAHYAKRDYALRPFKYDKPFTYIRAVTWATTNPIFIGLRKVIQKHTNPEQELKGPLLG